MRPADKLQVKAGKIPLFVCLSRSKQDPINRGHGAQCLNRPSPAGAEHCTWNQLLDSLGVSAIPGPRAPCIQCSNKPVIPDLDQSTPILTGIISDVMRPLMEDKAGLSAANHLKLSLMSGNSNGQQQDLNMDLNLRTGFGGGDGELDGARRVAVGGRQEHRCIDAAVLGQAVDRRRHRRSLARRNVHLPTVQAVIQTWYRCGQGCGA